MSARSSYIATGEMARQEGIYASAMPQSVVTPETDHGLTLSPKILSGDQVSRESYWDILQRHGGADLEYVSLKEIEAFGRQNEVEVRTESELETSPTSKGFRQTSRSPVDSLFDDGEESESVVDATCPSLVHSSMSSNHVSPESTTEIDVVRSSADGMRTSGVGSCEASLDAASFVGWRGSSESTTGDQLRSPRAIQKDTLHSTNIQCINGLYLPSIGDGVDGSSESGGVGGKSQEDSGQARFENPGTRQSPDTPSTSTPSQINDSTFVPPLGRFDATSSMASPLDLLAAVINTLPLPAPRRNELLGLLSGVRDGLIDPTFEREWFEVMNTILMRFHSEENFQRFLVAYMTGLLRTQSAVRYIPRYGDDENDGRALEFFRSSENLYNVRVFTDQRPHFNPHWTCDNPQCLNINWTFHEIGRLGGPFVWVSNKLCCACGSGRWLHHIQEADQLLERIKQEQLQQMQQLAQSIQLDQPVQNFPSDSVPAAGNFDQPDLFDPNVYDASMMPFPDNINDNNNIVDPAVFDLAALMGFSDNGNEVPSLTANDEQAMAEQEQAEWDAAFDAI